jgi:hypothetical protein
VPERARANALISLICWAMGLISNGKTGQLRRGDGGPVQVLAAL